MNKSLRIRQFHIACLLVLFGLAGFVSPSAAEKAPNNRPAPPAQTKPSHAKIDLNKATQAELETLPGIGSATAQNIIAARPFKNVADLKNVPGIGDARYSEVRPLVTVSRATSATASKNESARSPRPASRESTPRVETTPQTTRRPLPSGPAAPRSGLTDLNTADAATLETLPGVGPATAQNIIAARPFNSVEELKDVRGIGDARFEELRSLVTVRKTRTPAAGAPPPSTRGRTPLPTTESTTERPSDRPVHRTPPPLDRKININTATKEELESLLGIGPVKAQAIIDQRPYKSIDEVMEVKGIKDGTFEKIQDRITVR
jgi:competence protein ComEA